MRFGAARLLQRATTRTLGLMKTYVLRANVQVSDQVSDRDAWAVDVVEGSNLPEQLKDGWFWATRRNSVEFVFSWRDDEDAIEKYSREIQLLLSAAPNVAAPPQLVVEVKGGHEA